MTLLTQRYKGNDTQEDKSQNHCTYIVQNVHCTCTLLFVHVMITIRVLKANSYFDAWRLTHDRWLTHDGSVDARLVLFRVCLRQNAGSTEEGKWQLSKYCTVHYRTHWYSVELAQKSRALLYSDLVRQTNRHASTEPSWVNRQSMIQTLQFHYSYFLGRHASTVMRQSMNWPLNCITVNVRTFSGNTTKFINSSDLICLMHSKS